MSRIKIIPRSATPNGKSMVATLPKDYTDLAIRAHDQVVTLTQMHPRTAAMYELLMSDAATVTRNGTKKAMMFNDVARAYFEAPVKRKICIELPKEDWTQEDGNQDLVGLLQKSLYGTRDAASNFQAEIKSFMQNIGFRCGRYNPCTYWD